MQDHPQQEDEPVLLKMAGMAEFKDEMRRVRHDAADLTRKLDDLLEKTKNFGPTTGVLLKSFRDENGNHSTPLLSRRKSSQILPEKEFVRRNSVLTDLFQSQHFRTIENVAISALVLWALSTGVSDYYETKSFMAALPSLTLIENAFANYQIAIIVWIKLLVLSFVPFPVARYWAISRPKTPNVTNYDRLFLAGYFAFQIYFLSIPFRVLFTEPILGPAAAISLSMEQIRFILKNHSFVREISKRIIKSAACQDKKNDGDEGVEQQVSPMGAPEFSRYLYFMFAPTLIYRDVYPRTEATDWGYVFSNFAQVIGCVIYVYYVLQRYLEPEFETYLPNTVTFETIIKAAFRCVIPGTTVYIMTFFGFLHSWLNAWAEMLRFGDRLFYKDWWNVTNYAEYWRTWNTLVHDWLYTYIYKDSQELFAIKRSKLFSSCLVFAASAIVHEYIVVAMLKFFYPILLLEFGALGFPLMYVKSSGNRVSNVILWTSIFLGMGLMISMYSFEISARRHCPPAFDNNLLFDALVPRFISCMK